MKTKTSLVFALVTFVLLTTFVSSVQVYVRPPKVVFRVESSFWSRATKTAWIEFKNPSNESMRVEVQPYGNISSFLTYASNSFELEPGKSLNLSVTFSSPSPGKYYGGLNVDFYVGNSTTPLTLKIPVGAIVEGEEYMADKVLLITAAVLISVVILWFVRKKF